MSKDFLLFPIGEFWSFKNVFSLQSIFSQMNSKPLDLKTLTTCHEPRDFGSSSKVSQRLELLQLISTAWRAQYSFFVVNYTNMWEVATHSTLGPFLVISIIDVTNLPFNHCSTFRCFFLDTISALYHVYGATCFYFLFYEETSSSSNGHFTYDAKVCLDYSQQIFLMFHMDWLLPRSICWLHIKRFYFVHQSISSKILLLYHYNPSAFWC